jgi:hypothetical protein
MYKKTRLSLMIVVAGLVVLSCSTQKTTDHHEVHADSVSDDSWKAMDEFHMIMAETFHPFKDSSNLQPVKMQYKALIEASEKWVNSPIPAKVNTGAMKAKLQQLNADVNALAEGIETEKPDQDIGVFLTILHDRFHEIQELWYGGGEHEHH